MSFITYHPLGKDSVSNINADASGISLGEIKVSGTILELLSIDGIIAILKRHRSGDWGDIAESRRFLNGNGSNKVFSRFPFPFGKVRVITLKGQPRTLVMLGSKDYGSTDPQLLH